jgi:hypothetical protein
MLAAAGLQRRDDHWAEQAPGNVKVLRVSGETVKAMQQSAAKLMPDVRVWFKLYADEHPFKAP